MTELFKSSFSHGSNCVYGELNLEVKGEQYELLATTDKRKIYARECLSQTFLTDLYRGAIGNLINVYGPFVLRSYIAGGKATALYTGKSVDGSTSESRENGLSKDINASFEWKSNSTSGNLSFGKNNGSGSSSQYETKETEIYIQTFSGDPNYQAIVGPRDLENLSVDLSSWLNSLNDRNTYTIIDITSGAQEDECGLYLMSDFVLEKNYGDLSAEPYPKECCSWAKVTGIEPCGTDEFAVTLRISKNEGLGRIVAVDFKIDGKPVIQECGPCVIQRPAPFGEDVSVVIEKEGSLPVLLGDETDNLRRIRSLTLTGPINEIDFPVIKKLFLDTEESFAQYPIDIDLTECGIIAGDKNPYEYYGWTPTEIYEEILFWGELPSDIFNDALNLKGIVLPKGLKAIDRSAFSGCKNLKRISIPNTVEEINSKAFYGCTGLEEINIDPDCNLTTIGHQAFATGSVLKSLTIPMTVSNMSG